jgi:hypothetical protein
MSSKVRELETKLVDAVFKRSEKQGGEVPKTLIPKKIFFNYKTSLLATQILRDNVAAIERRYTERGWQVVFDTDDTCSAKIEATALFLNVDVARWYPQLLSRLIETRILSLRSKRL